MTIPIKLIALDLVGALLVTVGCLDLMGDGGLDGILYLVFGSMLMAPLIIHIVGKLPSGKSTEQSNGDK